MSDSELARDARRQVVERSKGGAGPDENSPIIADLVYRCDRCNKEFFVPVYERNLRQLSISITPCIVQSILHLLYIGGSSSHTWGEPQMYHECEVGKWRIARLIGMNSR